MRPTNPVDPQPSNDPPPLGAWDLRASGRDTSGQGRHARAIGDVAFGPSTDPLVRSSVARLHATGRLEVDSPWKSLGGFTVAAWVNAAAPATTVLGDAVSWYDARSRHGFTLGFEHGSPCGSHGNDRTAWFGVDTASEPRVTDHGKPGDASIMVCSLAVFEGSLFASTWEEGPTPQGRVLRLGADAWEDCGAPWDANAVTRLAVHAGALYAGVSRLRGGGSGRDDSANQAPGGHILRYEGGQSWSDMGALDGADSITALVPFAGTLYAAGMYSEGVFRMDGPRSWRSCGSPGRRLLALGVHGGALYGAGNDHVDAESAIALTKAGIVVPARDPSGGGGMFRYDGDEQWASCGLQRDTTQVYSIETYRRRLHIGTWPTGLVYRADDLEGPNGATWVSTGRLGTETEVMNLQSYNGQLYAGTLPHAQVFRYAGDDDWALVATLDETPNVTYRRAASMALFRGELFVGTLPSARVHSIRAGAVATLDTSVAPGWHHLAGVRDGREVRLYVDGVLAATGTGDIGELMPAHGTPLMLGGGVRADLEGELADVRVWDRPLDPALIAFIAGAAGHP